MPTHSAAVDYRSTYAPTFPTLPAGMQRSQVERLLSDVAPAIGLSGARLHALLTMIGYTRPQAWIDPDDEPVCYASQVELAAHLGLTNRAVRGHEAALSEGLGLVEKRTAANGSRSRSGGLGIVFSRLIELVPQLLALRERREAERSQVQTLVRLRTCHFRHLRKGLAELHPACPDDPQLGAIRDAMLAWPPSGALRGMGLAALEAHVAEARRLCDAFDALARETPDGPGLWHNVSGRADETFRSHTEDTTQEHLYSCSSEELERLIEAEHPNGAAGLGSRAEPRSDARSPTPAKNPAEPDRQDLFLNRLAPRRLYELAGEDFRLCLDMAGRPPERLEPIDFVTAAIQLVPALGISDDAWTDATETMGDFRAAMCLLITDANRTHPVTPVRKPGGHLRALTQRHRAGQLNLAGSLIGLAERQDAG